MFPDNLQRQLGKGRFVDGGATAAGAPVPVVAAPVVIFPHGFSGEMAPAQPADRQAGKEEGKVPAGGLLDPGALQPFYEPCALRGYDRLMGVFTADPLFLWDGDLPADLVADPAAFPLNQVPQILLIP